MNFQGERNVAGAVGNLGQLAGNPFGPQFQIPQRGIRGMTPAQIQELKDWDPGSASEIERIYKNIQPGGPQLFPRAGVMGGMGIWLVLLTHSFTVGLRWANCLRAWLKLFTK